LISLRAGKDTLAKSLETKALDKIGEDMAFEGSNEGLSSKGSSIDGGGNGEGGRFRDPKSSSSMNGSAVDGDGGTVYFMNCPYSLVENDGVW